MVICVKCRQEMFCSRTGRVAVWHGSHCYASDEYTCSTCGACILKCNTNSYHCDGALEKLGDKALEMGKNER